MQAANRFPSPAHSASFGDSKARSGQPENSSFGLKQFRLLSCKPNKLEMPKVMELLPPAIARHERAGCSAGFI